MEILGLIIIVLIWVFKAAAANEDKKVNDRETGSVSVSPDELIKKAKRTVEGDLGVYVNRWKVVELSLIHI